MIERPVIFALGPRGLAALRMSDPDGTGFGLCPLEPDPTLQWLPEAVEAAREALSVRSGTTVDWLILRPLALGKVLELPPVRRGSLRTLATANIERFFPVAAAEWTADAWPVDRGREGPCPTLVAALPNHVLEAVQECVTTADLRLGRIVPAPAAVALHAPHIFGRVAPGTICSEFQLPGYTEIVRLQHGKPTGLIPLPEDEAIGSKLRAGFADGTSASCPVTKGWKLAIELTARAASERRLPQPLSPSLLAKRKQRSRLRSGILVVAACAALLAGFALLIVDARRELRSLQGVRRELAADVEQAVRQREAVETLTAGVERLAGAEKARTDWAHLFSDLASVLPASAYLTRVTGRPDSLALTVATDESTTARTFGGASFDVLAREGASRSAVRLIASWNPNAKGGDDAD